MNKYDKMDGIFCIMIREIENHDFKIFKVHLYFLYISSTVKKLSRPRYYTSIHLMMVKLLIKM